MTLDEIIRDEIAHHSGKWSDVAKRIAARVAAAFDTVTDTERADMATVNGLRFPASDVVVWDQCGVLVVWLGNHRDYGMDALGEAVLP